MGCVYEVFPLTSAGYTHMQSNTGHAFPSCPEGVYVLQIGLRSDK